MQVSLTTTARRQFLQQLLVDHYISMPSIDLHSDFVLVHKPSLQHESTRSDTEMLVLIQVVRDRRTDLSVYTS